MRLKMMILILTFFVFVGCQTAQPKKINRTSYPGAEQQQSGKQTRQSQRVSPSSSIKPSAARTAPPQTPSMIGAVIGSDGVAVFEDFNFDASVVGYLERGQKVQASVKGMLGKSGFGTFHKIVQNGKTLGFVTDVDLVFNQSEMPLPSKKSSSIEQGPFIDEENFQGDENEGGEPSFLKRKVGGYLGSYNYTETVYKKARTASHYFYGAKLTGPGTFFQGPPIDSNILFSFNPPSFYSYVTESAPSGFMLFVDALLMSPFIAWETGSVLYGVGAMVLFNKYTLPIDGVAVDSQELRLGGVLGLSANVDLTPKLSLQGDFRYYFETNSYFGFGIALVTPY